MDGRKFPITSASAHPQFDAESANLEYDFAVLQIESPEPLTIKATVASNDPTLSSRKDLKIAGVGITEPGSIDFGKLRVLPVQISDAHFSNHQFEVREGVLSGACHGDSGGPGYYVNGTEVVVWGTDSLNSPKSTRDCYEFELYANVASARDWIMSQAMD